ncbi:MAG: hypothetical protein ACPGNT_10250 [Rhodospirillales bacterium]
MTQVSETSRAGGLQAAVADHAAGRLDRAEVAYRLLAGGAGGDDRPERLLTILETERALAKSDAPDWTLLVNPLLDLGGIAFASGWRESAEMAFRRALRAKPGSPAATAALAQVLRERGLLAETLVLNDSLIRVDPKNARYHHERAVTLRKLDRMGEAVDGFQAALALKPDDAPARWGLATTLIQSGPAKGPEGGREGEGWRLSAARWQLPTHESRPRDRGLPAWTGEKLEGALLVWGEQGVGDEVMFAGLLRQASERTGGLVLDLLEKVAPLWRRSFPEARLIGSDHEAPLDVVAQVAMGDLPAVVAGDAARIGPLDPWLRADADRTRSLRQLYREGLGAGPLVGLCWRTGSDRLPGRNPDLPLWRPVLETKGARFVSLQPRPRADDIRLFRSWGAAVIHDAAIDAWDDLDAYAAQLSALDLVISVDCTTVHLAGALGLACWTLLPWPADYRWPRHGAGTGWYPSMKLFPCAPDGDWVGPFSALVETLGRDTGRLQG